MTTFTAPPDQTGLILGRGDILNVNAGGKATGTTIGLLGVENVNGGTSIDTTIKRGGVENVLGVGGAGGAHGVANEAIIEGGKQEIHRGGAANGTIINNDGSEFVYGGGTANGTIVNDGTEYVFGSGISNDATINRGGTEYLMGGASSNTTIHGGQERVEAKGIAQNVIFDGPGSLLALAKPSGLTGTISNWSVGDVVDFSETKVERVVENDTHTTLTITYFDPVRVGRNELTATYSLANQQADTKFELRSVDAKANRRQEKRRLQAR